MPTMPRQKFTDARLETVSIRSKIAWKNLVRCKLEGDALVNVADD